jgi:hypothetical protein
MHMHHLQAHTVETGVQVFGEANMINKEERLLRMTEEFFELIRAAGLKFKDAAAMLSYEYYERPRGEVSQEVAGVQCTLFSFAEAHGIDIETVTLKELARVLNKKEEARAKHAAKPASMRVA